MAYPTRHIGTPLARVLADRGIVLSPDAAADLTRLLLDLAVAGALAPGLPAQPLPAGFDLALALQPPSGDAGAVHRRRPSGQPTAVVRRGPQTGPTVYNMGPSIHGSDGEGR